MARRRRERSCPLRPKMYEARTECSLEGLLHALSASLSAAQFLLAQEGPDWPRADLLDNARRDINTAARWLQKAGRFSQRGCRRNARYGRRLYRGKRAGCED